MSADDDWRDANITPAQGERYTRAVALAYRAALRVLDTELADITDVTTQSRLVTSVASLLLHSVCARGGYNPRALGEHVTRGLVDGVADCECNVSRTPRAKA